MFDNIEKIIKTNSTLELEVYKRTYEWIAKIKDGDSIEIAYGEGPTLLIALLDLDHKLKKGD